MDEWMGEWTSACLLNSVINKWIIKQYLRSDAFLINNTNKNNNNKNNIERIEKYGTSGISIS